MSTNCNISGGFCTILKALTTNIVNPALLLVSGIALLVFVWGIVSFLYSISKGEKAADGKQHMFWGAVGMFIILSAFAIYNTLVSTITSLG